MPEIPNMHALWNEQSEKEKMHRWHVIQITSEMKMDLVSSLGQSLLSFFCLSRLLGLFSLLDKLEDFFLSFLTKLNWWCIPPSFSSSWTSGMTGKFSEVDSLIFFWLNVKDNGIKSATQVTFTWSNNYFQSSKKGKRKRFQREKGDPYLILH